MEITGMILEIGKTVEIKDGFKKREFIVRYSEKPEYPEYLKLEAVQDKCDMLDKFMAGQVVTVHFNLRGRCWINPQGENVYFNTLQVWRLEERTQLIQDPETIDTSQLDELNESDDLPF